MSNSYHTYTCFQVLIKQIMGNAQNNSSNEALVTECFVDEDEVPSYKCMVAQMTSTSSFGSGETDMGSSDELWCTLSSPSLFVAPCLQMQVHPRKVNVASVKDARITHKPSHGH